MMTEEEDDALWDELFARSPETLERLEREALEAETEPLDLDRL